MLLKVEEDGWTGDGSAEGAEPLTRQLQGLSSELRRLLLAQRSSSEAAARDLDRALEVLAAWDQASALPQRPGPRAPLPLPQPEETFLALSSPSKLASTSCKLAMPGRPASAVEGQERQDDSVSVQASHAGILSIPLAPLKMELAAEPAPLPRDGLGGELAGQRPPTRTSRYGSARLIGSNWLQSNTSGKEDIGGLAEELVKLRPRRLAVGRVAESIDIAGAAEGEGSTENTTSGRRRLQIMKFVQHPVFDSSCALMIIANSALIGMNVEYMVSHDKLTRWQDAMGLVFAVFFSLELVVRVAAQGMTFLSWKNENRWWNIFDTVLVTVSLVDIMVERVFAKGESNSLASGMKTIKMLRIARVFRVFRFFRELALLALMIADSIKSLIWALLMLILITYVFAIIFTQGATDYLRAHGDSDLIGIAEVERQFGSLGKTSYSLGQAMLGGVSWGVVSDALLTIDFSLPALFFFYIAFTMLAVLNIITGVFVDNAVETANQQRDVLVQKEIELKEKMVVQLRNLFGEMDKNHAGSITCAQVKEFLDDPRVSSYFAALGLDVSDATRLFHLIDDDGSGDVSVDEFLDGCLRLKGPARSIDVHALLHAQRRLAERFEEAVAAPLAQSDLPLVSAGGRKLPVCSVMEGVPSQAQDAKLVPTML